VVVTAPTRRRWPPLVDRTLAAVRACCATPRCRDEVQGVVMVGGSTRMPLVRTAVGELFGREVLTDVDPDEVVAWARPSRPTQLAGNRRTASCCCWT
jgi:molecular chaperone HscA